MVFMAAIFKVTVFFTLGCLAGVVSNRYMHCNANVPLDGALAVLGMLAVRVEKMERNSL
jgi:hypothetical protein